MAFPATPTDGQTFTLDGRDYVYHAATDLWELLASGGTTVANTAPTGATKGDIWIDDTDPSNFVWHVHDGTSFVELKAGGSIPVAATNPTGGAAGDMYYNNSPANAGVYINDGSAWWRIGVKYTAATGGAPTDATGTDGDIGNNTTTGRTYIRANGTYRSVSGPYTVNFSADNKVQDFVQLPNDALHFVEFAGHFENYDTRNRFGIIGQQGAAGWINWANIKETRSTGLNWGGGGIVWYNWWEDNIQNTIAGMQLTGGDGIANNSRAYFKIVIRLCDDEPTMEWRVRFKTASTDRWVTVTGDTVFAYFLNLDKISHIGYKMFAGDKTATTGGNITMRATIRYY